MELDDRALPLTRGQLDIWLAQETGRSPLMHAVELNAGMVDTDTNTETGVRLHANWTWAPSALGDAQVGRLSRLWFDALAGICAHVRTGGGGLTPSDIAASLSQQQIDELQGQYADR